MTIRYLPSVAFSLERLRGLWQFDRPGIFWRHDIDHDLGCALAMAIREHDAGISATYYLRADNEAYDCRSSEFNITAHAIIELGHTLGAHVDLGLPRSATVSDDHVISACVETCLSLTHLPIERRVSFHKPPEEVLWREVQGFEHALGPRWLDRYVSDSRRRFRQSPEVLLSTDDGPVQVNLHPLWWFMDPHQAEIIRLEHEVAAVLDARRDVVMAELVDRSVVEPQKPHRVTAHRENRMHAVHLPDVERDVRR
jgi:hypothetical protein